MILALLATSEPQRDLAAGFEEEGVPLRCEPASGEAHTLAREAARRSPLGLGVGGDGQRLVLVIAAAPGHPYLESATENARAFGHSAARVAARRPLRTR